MSKLDEKGLNYDKVRRAVEDCPNRLCTECPLRLVRQFFTPAPRHLCRVDYGVLDRKLVDQLTKEELDEWARRIMEAHEDPLYTDIKKVKEVVDATRKETQNQR